MSIKIGLEAKSYRLSTGTRLTWGTANADGMNAGAAPGNLDELGNIGTVDYTIDDGAADVSVRAGNGWKAEIPTLSSGSFNLTFKHDPADPDVIALIASKLKRTTIALAILDGDKATAGTMGIWADFRVFTIAKGEPLEDAQTIVFTVRPTASAVPPEWVKVA